MLSSELGARNRVKLLLWISWYMAMHYADGTPKRGPNSQKNKEY
jgi:hypothetical protein